ECNPPETNQKKSWASLFTKRERGPSMYKMSVTPRGPKSKNNNAIIIPIGIFTEIPLDTILQAIDNTYEAVLLGAKFRFTQRGRTHLELIFHTFSEMKMHLQKDITLFSQTLREYYASSAGHTCFNIILRNMPFSGKETL